MFFPFFLCLVTGIHVYGQGKNDTTIVITDTTNIDALFKKARNLSYDGNYAQAKRILIKILEKKPNYYEVRTMLGRTYAWDKQYEMARTELSRVLIEKENDYEALNALFDVEFWTESYSLAADYLKVALGYYPTSEELLLKKAKLQIRLEEKSEAAVTLRRILDLNPSNKQAIQLMNTLEGRKLNNNFQASYLVDLFSKTRLAQQLTTLEYGHNFQFGLLTGRVNYADKFEQQGFQYEIESYPHITKSTYLDLIAAFSQEKIIFPKQKYLIDIYQKVGSGWEFSAGMRYLKYDHVTKVYSVSISNYYKDYWFNVRTYITPRDSTFEVPTNKPSATVLATIRRYLGDSDNFIGVKGGYGSSPNEQNSSDPAQIILFYPVAQYGVSIQRRAFNRWIMKLEFTLSNEKPVHLSYNRYSTQVTVKTVF